MKMPSVKFDWTVPVPLLLALAAGAISGTMYITSVAERTVANAEKITEIEDDFEGADVRQRVILEKVTRIDTQQASMQRSLGRLVRTLRGDP